MLSKYLNDSVTRPLEEIFVPIRQYLPLSISNGLFGDRERWGVKAHDNDPMWIEWIERYTEIYRTLQKSGVGRRVNNAGHRILREIDLTGLTVLEIGPGELTHHSEWIGKPAKFFLADHYTEFIRGAQETLDRLAVANDGLIVEREVPFRLDVSDASIDIVLSFSSLEHLNPLADHLGEISRVLRPGGSLVGAIPTEGGLAWGLGRYMTSRRWFLKNTAIDLMKIICWEHPNFADDIFREMDSLFSRKTTRYWPLKIPAIDLNLMVSFIARKAAG